MRDAAEVLRASVIAYCAAIGGDPLLVQGAGGNVSWKDGDKLWIKASGTWLAQAANQDIFVPVDLGRLRDDISRRDFAVTPIVLGGSNLRPSIETLLHALMPQRVVVHLHAVEILAHLVRENGLNNIQALLNGAVTWTAVPYKKPGEDLAAAVCDALDGTMNANVVFLQNHGVVVGGNDTQEIANTLKTLTDALQTVPMERRLASVPSNDIGAGYIPVADTALHHLAKDPELFSRLDSQWALYPDHVVFLGAAAKAFNTSEALQYFLANENVFPELIFVKDVGVFVQPQFSPAKQQQLRCYYDVLVRLERAQAIDTLSSDEVCGLLNWDAEKYRMTLLKQH